MHTMQEHQYRQLRHLPCSACSGACAATESIGREFVQALASAIADVIAGAAAFCDAAGNGSICFAAESNISALVEVQSLAT